MRQILLILTLLLAPVSAWAQGVVPTGNPVVPWLRYQAQSSAPAAQTGTVTNYYDGAHLNLPSFQVTSPGTSALTTDQSQIYGALNNSSITPDYISSCAISNCTTSVSLGDAVRGIGTYTSGSTINQVDGIAGYTLNNAAHGTGEYDTVAVSGVGICAVNNSACWGTATLLTDNLGQTITSNTGIELYNESDFNVTSPNTGGAGYVLGGTWLVQPSPGINGFVVSQPGTVGKWASAFSSANGSSNIGLSIGASAASGDSVNGQPVYLNYFDSSGTLQNTSLTATPNALILGGSTAVNNFTVLAGNVNLAEGYNLSVGGQGMAGTDSSNNAYIATGSSLASVTIGTSSIATAIPGKLTVGGIYIGTPPAVATLAANPPVSGTAYQWAGPGTLELAIPVTLNPTSSAAATATLDIGSTSSPTSIMDQRSLPDTLTTADGEITTLRAEIPAGWYYEVTTSNATIGTATAIVH